MPSSAAASTRSKHPCLTPGCALLTRRPAVATRQPRWPRIPQRKEPAMKFLYDRPIALKTAFAPLAAILFLTLLWLTGLSGMGDQKVAIEDLYNKRFSVYQSASGVANEITAIHGNIFRIIAFVTTRKYTDELQKNAEEQSRRLKTVLAEL